MMLQVAAGAGAGEAAQHSPHSPPPLASTRYDMSAFHLISCIRPHLEIGKLGLYTTGQTGTGTNLLPSAEKRKVFTVIYGEEIRICH